MIFQVNGLTFFSAIQDSTRPNMFINILLSLFTVYIVYKLFLDRSLSHEQIQQKVNGKFNFL